MASCDQDGCSCKSLSPFPFFSLRKSNTNILPGPPHPIDIGILYQLEKLHFLVNFHTTSYPVFTELLALLAQVSSNTIFHELVIECQFLRAVELVACASD